MIQIDLHEVLVKHFFLKYHFFPLILKNLRNFLKKSSTQIKKVSPLIAE